jgi:predicted ATPase
VERLCEHSLLRQEDGVKGEPRFHMLETVREYASERLTASEEEEIVASAHTICFLDLAEATVPRLSGPEEGRWLIALEAENDNMRAALTRAIESDP